jgi:tetratricopeptide (TPR) repeat protein
VEAQRKLSNAYLNNIHEARARGDFSAVDQFADLARDQILLYESDEALSHANPQWIIATMWAAFFFALGKIKEAYEHDLRAESFAKSIEEKAKTEHNLAEELRHLGEIQSALQRAKHAIKLDPTLAPAYVNLVLCYNAAGDFDQADRLLRRLIAAADFQNDSDLLAASLRFDLEVRQLQLPAAISLVEIM